MPYHQFTVKLNAYRVVYRETDTPDYIYADLTGSDEWEQVLDGILDSLSVEEIIHDAEECEECGELRGPINV